MTDIFQEVDEDLRRDKAMTVWMRYRTLVIGAAIAIVVGTAGWQGWIYYRDLVAGKAADKFLSAVDLADKGKSAEAIAAFEANAGSAPAGYAALDRLREASEKAKTGDAAGAVVLLDQVAADSAIPQPVRDLAKIRAAAVLVDTGSLSDVENRVGAFDDPGSVWRNVAHELIGLAAYNAGNYARARQELVPVTTDLEASEGLKTRANLILDLVDAALGPVGSTASGPAKAPVSAPVPALAK